MTTAMTNMQKNKQNEIHELQKQNQYLLQNINELREHVVNLSEGFTTLQQNNAHKEQQWAQQQNDINQRLTSLQQAIPPLSFLPFKHSIFCISSSLVNSMINV